MSEPKQSDTPETDAVWKLFGDSPATLRREMTKLAVKLERERNAARAIADARQSSLEESVEIVSELRARVAELEKEVEQAKADRNRAGVEERRKYLPKIAELEKDNSWLENSLAKMLEIEPEELNAGDDPAIQTWSGISMQSFPSRRQAINAAMKGPQ